MEKKITLAFKGILLYATMIAVMLFVGGVDSIYDNGYFTTAIIVAVALVYACYKLINKEEADKLLLNKYFGEPEEDDKW